MLALYGEAKVSSDYNGIMKLRQSPSPVTKAQVEGRQVSTPPILTSVYPRISAYGVRWVRNYMVLQAALPSGMPLPTSGIPTFQNPTAGMMPEFKVLSKSENPFGVGFAVQYDFMLIEPPLYLAELLADFRAAGGKVRVKRLRSANELNQLPESLIFNCTGLGAGKIFGDGGIQPLRGQLSILLPQPEIEFATAYRDSYMFPRRDGILVGGTHDLGDWNLTPSVQVRDERSVSRIRFTRR